MATFGEDATAFGSLRFLVFGLVFIWLTQLSSMCGMRIFCMGQENEGADLRSNMNNFSPSLYFFFNTKDKD